MHPPQGRSQAMYNHLLIKKKKRQRVREKVHKYLILRLTVPKTSITSTDANSQDNAGKLQHNSTKCETNIIGQQI